MRAGSGEFPDAKPPELDRRALRLEAQVSRGGHAARAARHLVAVDPQSHLSLDGTHVVVVPGGRAAGGNSGVFLWAPPEAFFGIEPGQLPRGGIEVQILDHGFRTRYEASGGRKGDWF